MRRGGAEEGLPLALPRSKAKHSPLTNTTMSHLWIPYRSDPEGPTPSIQPSPKHVPAPAGEVNKAGSQSVSAITLSQLTEVLLILKTLNSKFASIAKQKKRPFVCCQHLTMQKSLDNKYVCHGLSEIST